MPQDVGYAAVIPLTEDKLEHWRKEVERARKVRESAADRFDWEGNLDRYAPKDAKKSAGQVNVGADFADVERKKAALFYASPDVSLVPDDPDQPLAAPQPPQPGQPAPPPPPTLGSVTLAHQDLLNELVGPDFLNIKATVLKCLQDVLLVSGVGAVQVGYTAITETVDVPVPDPMTGQPAVDPATGELQAQATPIPIHEEFFVSRLSPMALLMPADFRDTDVRNAPWIGYDFQKPESAVKSWLGLPDEMELPAGQEKPYLRKDEDAAGEGDRLVSGCYIEYKSALAGLSKHPQAVHCLVLIDGIDEPVKHAPSAHQSFDDMGRLSPDSLRGFSIVPLWIRDLPDSAWVPSDSSITGPLTRELNTFRTQIIEQRDSAKQVILYDSSLIDPDAAAKIAKGEINQMIPVVEGALTRGVDSIMKQVATAQLGRESYLGQDYIAGDREKILGVSANQQGGTTNTKRSATEVSTIQRNTEARFNQEQARVLEWYLSVVRVLDALVLRHGDERLSVSILGPRKGGLWAQFKMALAGGYRHSLRVDSGKYLDIEAERRQLLQFYQMTRQDPLVNPRPLMRKLLQAWGIDPQEGIVEPKPATPPPPQAAFSLRGEDLSPLSAQFPIAIKIAQQGGWQITPEDIAAAQQHAQTLQQMSALVAAAGSMGQPAPDEKHKGAATQQMPISKRQMDETGAMPGPGGGLLS